MLVSVCVGGAAEEAGASGVCKRRSVYQDSGLVIYKCVDNKSRCHNIDH